MTDLDTMGRVITQRRGQAFQILGRVFGFLLRFQCSKSPVNMVEMLSRAF